MRGMDLLVLTTKGRKSGKKHNTPLAYVFDRKDRVVTASAGGSKKDPQWFKNLQADSQVEVNVKGNIYKAKAVVTKGKKRDVLWSQFLDLADNFGNYEKMSKRKIPVVVLRKV